ncbi:MAG: DegT/DnrJ/EryC1/StrS family aminotransferase [Duncaniella sp.]|nr:DegT/DnrJ/EryC1/StrS family aminotransferase [Muribaculum sp.]MCM1256183.1 DegT/DnrJ/EryC1/StrS family aminotransferase [Duncaniella sp.]
MKKKYTFLDLSKVNAPYEEEIVKAVMRVVKSGRYIGGEEIWRFEEEFSRMVGCRYTVGVSNGFDALKLILKGYIELGVMCQGDEVIVPANTYIASILAIKAAGLTPVLVDASISTMNIDSNLLERAITERTRGIMTVHLYGRVAWDEKLKDVALRYKLKVIEDCAQAIGGKAHIKGLNRGYDVGVLGDAGGFSFYPTKNIGGVGDGGAITTNDEDLAAMVRVLANYGSDRRFHNIYCGENCRLDAIQAAILRVKLPHIESTNADRFERALVYERMINHPAIVKPIMSRYVTDNVWHQYVVRVTNGRRDKIRNMLLDLGIETDVHYPVAPHHQPCFSGKIAHVGLPVTELLADEVMSLPISSGTTVKDASEIAEMLNSIKM